MKIDQIENGCATVILYPDDCFLLANACHEAEDAAQFFEDETQLQLVRLMASACAALGVAT